MRRCRLTPEVFTGAVRASRSRATTVRARAAGPAEPPRSGSCKWRWNECGRRVLRREPGGARHRSAGRAGRGLRVRAPRWRACVPLAWGEEGGREVYGIGCAGGRWPGASRAAREICGTAVPVAWAEKAAGRSPGSARPVARPSHHHGVGRRCPGPPHPPATEQGCRARCPNRSARFGDRAGLPGAAAPRARPTHRRATPRRRSAHCRGRLTPARARPPNSRHAPAPSPTPVGSRGPAGPRGPAPSWPPGGTSRPA